MPTCYYVNALRDAKQVRRREERVGSRETYAVRQRETGGRSRVSVESRRETGLSHDRLQSRDMRERHKTAARVGSRYTGAAMARATSGVGCAGAARQVWYTGTRFKRRARTVLTQRGK
jgi:hypothetical protein